MSLPAAWGQPVAPARTGAAPLSTGLAKPLSARWVRAQFGRTDDGAGGRLQTLRRGIKFWFRCWWSARALQASASAFHESALGPIVEARPELALRPMRSYLRRGLGAARRAQALRSHFEWLAHQLPMPVIERLYGGECIALLDGAGAGAAPAGLGVSLSTAAHLGREGELVLQLEWQGEVLMSLAFSVLDARLVLSASDAPQPRGPRIVIGSLQGARNADAGLRELSSVAQRLRPSAVLVLAVQALTAAWGLAPPLGVAAQSHVYAGYASRRRKVALDYDAAWHDIGAQRTGRHYWSLPAQPLLRPQAQVESRRRAQHRRRNALRESLLASMRASASALRG